MMSLLMNCCMYHCLWIAAHICIDCIDRKVHGWSTSNDPCHMPAFSLCLRFSDRFPGEPGLASFSAAKDDASGGDNCSYNMCKAPVKSSLPTNQHPTFLRAGCPSSHPTNSVEALKGNMAAFFELYLAACQCLAVANDFAMTTTITLV